MNENAKTLTFVAVAVVAGVVAWASRPSLPTANPDDVRGTELYPNFTDPLAVTSLEIVEFDEATSTIRPFKVAQIDVNGKLVWRIPSHDNYPADAKDQVASAANSLMGLKILQKFSDNQGDQRECGVVDPDPQALKAGATGVGVKVLMKDKDDKTLVSLVIGKKVPGGKELPNAANLHYVRKAGDAAIYVVDIKTDKLSTKFENWIERNLLGINTFDMRQLWIQDYSVDQFQRALVQRGQWLIGYDDAGTPKWKLIENRKFASDSKDAQAGQWVSVALKDDEELNTAKLDALKNALDDLKIVDVSRKPEGLSANLKAEGDFAANREAVRSLAEYGFDLADIGNGVELFSNNGEERILITNGVQYVLRFGGIAGGGESSTKEDKEKESDDAEKKPAGSQLNRYLFVMAEFDPEAIPKPTLEPLPEPAKDEAQPDADAKPADETKPATDETKPADEKKAEAAKPEDAERARIEKENKRKQDEYDQKVADGKKKVSDLNARFADWYYIISDEVYRKIHLGRDELIKKKDAKDAAKDARSPIDVQAPPFGGNPADEHSLDNDTLIPPADEFDSPKENQPPAE